MMTLIPKDDDVTTRKMAWARMGVTLRRENKADGGASQGADQVVERRFLYHYMEWPSASLLKNQNADKKVRIKSPNA